MKARAFRQWLRVGALVWAVIVGGGTPIQADIVLPPIVPDPNDADRVSLGNWVYDDPTRADSWELRCTQSAKFLCVNVEGFPAHDDVLLLSGVVVSPNTMAGQANAEAIPPHTRSGFCFARPGTAGTMKALVIVGRQNLGAGGGYTLRAECYSRGTFGLISRETEATILQDE